MVKTLVCSAGEALSRVDSSLKERQCDPVQAEPDQAMRRIGELTMENELLWQRVRKPGVFRTMEDVRQVVRNFVELYISQWRVEKNDFKSTQQLRQD